MLKELSDDEIREAYENNFLFRPFHRKIARKAEQGTLRQIVEWLEEECIEHPFWSALKEEEYNRKKHRCPTCIESLKSQIK